MFAAEAAGKSPIDPASFLSLWKSGSPIAALSALVRPRPLPEPGNTIVITPEEMPVLIRRPPEAVCRPEILSKPNSLCSEIEPSPKLPETRRSSSRN